MADFEALRLECRTARQSGDYEAAIRAGQAVWDGATDRNGWDAWNLAFSLRKVGRHSDAMDVIWAGLKVIEDDPDAVAVVGGRLASEFGWSAYSAELKGAAKPQPSRIARTATAVVRTWDKYNGSVPWTTQFCPVPHVVNRTMKLLKEAQAWSHLADLAAMTDGDRMPDEPMRPEQAEQTQGDWTRAEAWYTAAAKAFVEESRFDEAISVVERSITRIPALGRHCMRWLYFQGAKAAIGVGDGARAVELVDLARSAGVNDWWMGVVQANAAELAGYRAAALEALADTFVAADHRRVPPEFLCSALEAGSRLLAESEPDLATLCARVNRGIRESHGWSIPKAVDLRSGGLSEPSARLDDIVMGWQRVRRAAQPRSNGTVTRLISEGSGFLRGADGVDRYFSYPRGVGMPSWCAPGQSVTFRPVRRFDAKAGIEKPAADDLEAVGPVDPS